MSSRQNKPTEPEPDRQKEADGVEEAAGFVAETLLDLVSICRRHRLDTLGYLLSMAHMEAEDIAQHPKTPHS
ncbi:conserved hypothetical protein [Afipia carboxidovorans OM5]|uniref:Uncharacterized protein n=1 Tax=Afipia carboxidovorans (strain ATCC 49405 / DSM 1227 / KCTC 32145 / OM5) TaxID=504832 RepID=B6JFV0_AFIC5|nr:hypothetical protein [Afipia carboxidovorans]ACI92910.1 conserved hypothetical protein [Afipia carboxidovorans OM5]AEI03350.1 hypothetical protein OCA4_c22240 [Afipia carboxidovorans OM4]AEI06927.1 hypothetical protein OCA5_c22250 [Afipia carboxidovorans OM5]BEV44239.1 hypothetical protein CRBSH125_04220 [Afipia carboxidovorans]